MKVLREELRYYVEVLLVIFEDVLDEVVDDVDVVQFELVLVNESDYLQNLFLKDLVNAYRLLAFVFVVLAKVGLEIFNQVLQLAPLLRTDTAVLPPAFALFLEILQRIIHEALVGGTQVIVVSCDALLSSLHSIECLSVIF